MSNGPCDIRKISTSGPCSLTSLPILPEIWTVGLACESRRSQTSELLCGRNTCDMCDGIGALLV